MEDDKYYYPESIEEISIGMSYQYCAITDEGIKVWFNYKFGMSYDFERVSEVSQLTKKIKNKEIRIPYLTKEDIIEEGYDILSDTKLIIILNDKEDKVQILFNIKNFFMNILYKGDKIFEGFIKNKTDFKRLLKQLNIK